LFFALVLSGYSLEVTLEGYSSNAPIIALDGTGTSDLAIDYIWGNGVNVHQTFTYSMANVNSGAVTCNGSCHITSSNPGYEWDASFQGSTTYNIKSYGSLAVVLFNHKLTKADSGSSLVRGIECDGGYVTSSGKSYVADDLRGGFYLYGYMSGIITGIKAGKLVQKVPYKNSVFVQYFDLSVSRNWASWLADYTLNSNSKGVVTGAGSLTFGNPSDPVDTVFQTVKGALSKTGIFSWSTTSISKSDSKVKITIKHTNPINPDVDPELIVGKNKISAAAQSRVF
jgi:hypothetical protein